MDAKKLKKLIGKPISFHAQRIIVGNPVKGKLLGVDDEWITVELAHELEGMVNVWCKGEEKMFRIILISNLRDL